ncbi:MAG: glycine zipper domain-containing protein [Deltaproteobacteria bacterium]|nr:glycine zipper domain-containing protein [Deltaproteobacteria bacterium]
MSRRILTLALVAIFTLSLAGCQTESGYYDPGRSAGAGALGGAATGAALGAIIGAATGSPATGAWIGAASGALVGGVGGYLYAEHRNSQISSQQAAAYSPSQGNLVSVDTADASPPVVRPGQQVNLGMTYTILTPSDMPVSVTLVREVRLNGQVIGQPYQTTVSNTNGTFNDFVAYSIPSNAPYGNYSVTSRVVSSYGSSSREAYFSIQ